MTECLAAEAHGGLVDYVETAGHDREGAAVRGIVAMSQITEVHAREIIDLVKAMDDYIP